MSTEDFAAGTLKYLCVNIDIVSPNLSTNLRTPIPSLNFADLMFLYLLIYSLACLTYKQRLNNINKTDIIFVIRIHGVHYRIYSEVCMHIVFFPLCSQHLSSKLNQCRDVRVKSQEPSSRLRSPFHLSMFEKIITNSYR